MKLLILSTHSYTKEQASELCCLGFTSISEEDFFYTTVDPNSYNNLTKLVQHFIDLIGEEELIVYLDNSTVHHLPYLFDTFPNLTISTPVQ